MTTKQLIKKFLQDQGRLADAHAGPRKKRVSQAEIDKFRKGLAKVAQSNSPVILLAAVWVILIGASAFGFAVAYGGDHYMSIYSSVASVLCLPIGLFLKSIWRDKFRAEVLLNVLPLLTPDQALDALERFYYNDKSEVQAKPEVNGRTVNSSVAPDTAGQTHVGAKAQPVLPSGVPPNINSEVVT